MRIGINGERLLIDKPAGPEIYTYNIVQALAKVDDHNDYIVFFNQNPPEGYFEKLTGGNTRFSYKVLRKRFSWTQVSLSLELLRHPVDVLFSAVHTVPIFRRKSLYLISMIHGLEYTYAKEYKNPLARLWVSNPIRYTCKVSTTLIVPSTATKDAILRKSWGVDGGKISVVPEGVSEIFYKRSDAEIRAVREKYSLGDGKYFLFVSTIQPRKNLPALVKAFSQMDDKEIKLVVVGKKGWLYEESLAAPEKFQVTDRVLFLGRVPTEDLPVLFSGATAFVSTSLEEGFGLPLLEAMACETPSVVSSIPAFKELGTDTVFYVDPTNVNNIAFGLNTALSSQDVSHLVKKAKARAKNYTWEEAARKTLFVFEDLRVST